MVEGVGGGGAHERERQTERQTERDREAYSARQRTWEREMRSERSYESRIRTGGRFGEQTGRWPKTKRGVELRPITG